MSKLKLVYYFNVSDLLEVKCEEHWVQVTSGFFRAFSGERRIKGEAYYGPVIYRDTNYLYEGPLNNTIVELEGWEDTSKLRKLRKNSKFSYSQDSV